jgi:hypothetical protein
VELVLLIVGLAIACIVGFFLLLYMGMGALIVWPITLGMAFVGWLRERVPFSGTIRAQDQSQTPPISRVVPTSSPPYTPLRMTRSRICSSRGHRDRHVYALGHARAIKTTSSL